MFVESLAKELASEASPLVVRQLAGIVLKNAISGTVRNSLKREKKCDWSSVQKIRLEQQVMRLAYIFFQDPSIDKRKREKWISLADSTAATIRECVLSALTSPCDEARSAACQVISKTGRLDLAMQRWVSLLSTLMQLVSNKEAPSAHRRAAVTAVGYLSEDISVLGQEANLPELLTKEQKNTILTTVMHAVNQTDDLELILAGCKALYHALLFAGENLVVSVSALCLKLCRQTNCFVCAECSSLLICYAE